MPVTSVPVAAAPVVPPAAGTTPGFAQLGVPAPLVDALARQGIAAPFPIQVATLPDTLAGRDVLGRGRTGSGKTLAFSLPMVSRLAGGSTRPRKPAVDVRFEMVVMSSTTRAVVSAR